MAGSRKTAREPGGELQMGLSLGAEASGRVAKKPRKAAESVVGAKPDLVDEAATESVAEDLAGAGDEGPRVWQVSELTRRVRDLLEGTIGTVWVRGEVSNLRRQASGHQYFTLKDAGSQIACVLFGGTARRMPGLRLADGQEIQLLGELTIYEARGQYQLVVQLVQETGVGALRAKFEAMKARLAAEGVFDAGRKRALPEMPMTIGVVTSPTGAAIRDFLNVLLRRMPGVRVVIYPVRVQGRGAAAEIAAAVRDFSEADGLPTVDVVVVTRGGGSLEDLWEFNEEVVARAIVASRVPVVSAVGHEIDFTIADFAADLRAPTPSAAAELIVPDAAELRRAVAGLAARMHRELREAVRFHRARLDGLTRSGLLREPERLLRERRLMLDSLTDALRARVDRVFREHRDRVRHASAVLHARRPDAAVALVRGRVAELHGRLRELTGRRIADLRHRADAAAGLLAAMSPEATLARGFTITLDEAGRVVRRRADVAVGDDLTTRFADGSVRVRVESAES